MNETAVRRAPAEHWFEDDQFARQLGNAAAAAVVRRRWQAFEAALRQFSAASGQRRFRVLDAGCGDGINLVALQRMLAALQQPADLVAIDASLLRTRRAHAAARGEAHTAVASVTALPFGDSVFDVVLCTHVLEHVEGPAVAAAELARILKPEGLALFGVPNEGCALASIRNHLLQRSILATTDHVNFFTPATFRRLLAGAGFAADVRGFGFFLPHLRLTNLVMRWSPGRRLLGLAGRVLPSQAADLVAVARRHV